MFTDLADDTPVLTAVPVRTIVTSLCVASCAVGIFLIYSASAGFTRGQIRDLPEEEQLVMNQIEKAGVLVSDATIPCTMYPHIVVSVNWKYSTGKYAVTAIGLRNAPFEIVKPHLIRLVSLKEVRAPYMRPGDVDAIQRQVPELAVNRRAEWSTNNAMHPSRESGVV